jgi:hypothetical protein
MATARLGQMVTLSPRRLAEQPLRTARAGRFHSLALRQAVTATVTAAAVTQGVTR